MAVDSKYVLGPGGYYDSTNNSGPYSISPTGAVTLLGSSGGGSGASEVSVNNFPVTQPVSATALPLPAGAATATGVTTVATNLGVTTARAAVTDPTLAADVNQLLRGILTALNQIVVNTTPVP